jgi:hypothetical protein
MKKFENVSGGSDVVSSGEAVGAVFLQRLKKLNFNFNCRSQLISASADGLIQHSLPSIDHCLL